MKKKLFHFCGLIIVLSLFSLAACTRSTTNNASATEKVKEYTNISDVKCVDENKKSRKPCTTIQKPVCGCNGVTYTNGCEADNNGVQIYHVGKCQKDAEVKPCFNAASIDLKRNCPDISAPVCGCNGQTYENGCIASKNGISSFTKGACKDAKTTATRNDCIDPARIEANKDKVCPEMYAPVCGCDGKTYDSKCQAKKAGVIIYTKGVCKDQIERNKSTQTADCIDASKINPDIMCPAVYKPVCGCDGKTYSNGCKAKAAGVQKYKEGPCGK